MSLVVVGSRSSEMRSSFVATALCLSLVQTMINARATNNRQMQHGHADIASHNGVFKWLGSLFTRDVVERQDTGSRSEICVEDEYYYFVYNSSFGQNFCGEYVNYQNLTTITDYIPTRQEHSPSANMDVAD